MKSHLVGPDISHRNTVAHTNSRQIDLAGPAVDSSGLPLNLMPGVCSKIVDDAIKQTVLYLDTE